MELVVVYLVLYGEYGTWVRPLGMFLGQVEMDSHPKNIFEEME
jgi:hypothetical protein